MISGIKYINKARRKDNKDAVKANYKVFDEASRAYSSRADSIEFHYTKKLLDKYIIHNCSVIELGCGTGYYGLYLADKCASYHGVDLVPKHIEQFKLRASDVALAFCNLLLPKPRISNVPYKINGGRNDDRKISL